MSLTGAGRKLSRTGAHRLSLLRNLTVDLIRYESVRTTTPKARELCRFAEHLISVAKSGSLVARRRVGRDVHDTQVLEKMFGVLKDRYKLRQGGYTRIFALGNREGDHAPVSLVKLVP